MTSKSRIERNQGYMEAPQHFAALREKWPLAFTAKDQDVRPLTTGASHEIAAEIGGGGPVHHRRAWAVENNVGPCFATTNALLLMARRPNRSVPRRRPWRPSS
jgi:hypothetical protein